MLNRATIATAALAAVMVVVAIMLTGTTIRMSAASRRTETEIMRLVGASNWTIRLPFILEGRSHQWSAPCFPASLYRHW